MSKTFKHQSRHLMDSWPNKSGYGKYFKRKLNKSLRKSWQTSHTRSLRSIISEVKMKGW